MISVGRVMTCVLGMVVRREREIRDFVKTPFYRVVSTIDAQGHQFEGEWKAVKGSRYFESYDLYKENGFKEREKAEELIRFLLEAVDQKEGPVCRIESIEKKKEKKNPPLLYNLAELQNDCSKRFKISPDETLAFGDNINDIEMLKRASHSFAVENAREEVKEVANFIAPSYKEDGVLQVLKAVLRGELA